MKRYIEEDNRSQQAMFPESLDDYIAQDNQVRVIDAFVDELPLESLGFERAVPKATGRPGYRPTTLLKIYLYGYINRIQSSRRLEREAQRNVELMWLVGRLQPDFKTIADFRKDNRQAIQNTCSHFVELCRQQDFFMQAVVAIDGSKFKAVNNVSKNHTRGILKRRIARTEEHIANYLSKLDEADSDEPTPSETDMPDLKEKLSSLRESLKALKEKEQQVLAHPDKQISETDKDARLMKQGSKGSLVGYNLQTAVDTHHKLIVAHKLTNSPTDRGQLLPVAKKVKRALRCDEMTVLADRGYYSGQDMKSCHDLGIKTLVPKPSTSGNKAAGLYDRADFKYDAEQDQYVCPANEILPRRGRSLEDGKNIDTYYASVTLCRECTLKSKCTRGRERRVRRWEHEALLESLADELRDHPRAMADRACTVEHPFGTLKLNMGATQILMKRLENVQTEMSLHVLAYNMKRTISILGVPMLIKAIREQARSACSIIGHLSGIVCEFMTGKAAYDNQVLRA